MTQTKPSGMSSSSLFGKTRSHHLQHPCKNKAGDQEIAAASAPAINNSQAKKKKKKENCKHADFVSMC